MTITLESFEVRNTDNNATIIISKEVVKFSSCPYWEVCVKPDRSPFAYVLKSGLKNKPTKKQIERYTESV